MYEEFNSEHRKMRAKQQHMCKEMNQYTNNTNQRWFLAHLAKGHVSFCHG